MKRSLALVAVAALFVLGVLTGVLGTHLFYARKAAEPGGLADFSTRVLVRQLDRRADLTDEQEEQIRSILNDAGREARQLRREVAPRVLDLTQRTLHRVRAELTPEQQEVFDRLVENRRRRLERWLPPEP